MPDTIPDQIISISVSLCIETYYTNTKAAGLDVDAYYYSYATTVSAVQADMEDFLSYIEGKTYEYPFYFDYEDSTQQALSSWLTPN